MTKQLKKKKVLKCSVKILLIQLVVKLSNKKGFYTFIYMTYVNCIRVFLVIKITEKLSIGFVSLSSFSKLKDLLN